MRIHGFILAVATVLLLLTAAKPAHAQKFPRFIMPEQRTIEVRHPAELAKARLPDVAAPRTVSDPQPDAHERLISLDEAIRIALENSDVVRLLTGVAAASSGRTIYDPAITNTLIDQRQARFDPTVDVRNSFNRFESPQAAFDPLDPSRAIIGGGRTDDYNLNLGLSKQTILGGTANLGVNTNPSRFQPGAFPLNPQNRSSAELSYTQPLLQGGGRAVNLAPIVLARIDTERSYFQFKDSMQELVRGVIDAYWALVFARTDVWARRQQVDQGEAAYQRAEARKRFGIIDAAELAQTRLAFANFRANLISAQANLLQREAALWNILGLPPDVPGRPVPTTPPTAARFEVDWNGVIALAEERRPDLVELKLIIEADEQLLLQARNQALPRVDAVMLYRWNGLEGEMPTGQTISTRDGQFADWTLGVNFSVPLGLRQSRASLRQQELNIARDRVNLDQGLHSTVHTLAISTRNLSQFYEQYLAFRETREAARLNLERQLADYSAGRAIFLNVLQAITDWGNAVSAEAQSLSQYNSELANLERQTGTILETHGVRFFEERFVELGPLGRWRWQRNYPSGLRPGPNDDLYPAGERPAEESFRLEAPSFRRPLAAPGATEELPRPNGSP